MTHDDEFPPPHEVSVLDETYLQHWEESVGAEMMPAFLEDLRATFEEEYQRQLAMITEACGQQQTQQLIKLLHYLKGSLGNMGLSRASAFARQAEVELRTDAFDRDSTFPKRLNEHVAEGLAALDERYQ